MGFKRVFLFEVGSLLEMGKKIGIEFVWCNMFVDVLEVVLDVKFFWLVVKL